MPRLPLVLLALGLLTGGCRSLTTTDRIRRAATSPNCSDNDHPLPLAAHWCTGSHVLSQGFQVPAQLDLIAQGHMLLPWMAHPPIDPDLAGKPAEHFAWYGYEDFMPRLAAARLPFSFAASQWESHLSRDPYISLPAAENPNVIGTDGEIRKMVSPFGPVAPWRELGRKWTDNPAMRRLQELYPNPPMVIFLSNNEHSKLHWSKVEESQRYMDRYGAGHDADFKRRVVAQGWIERYRALQAGMREGLVNPTWRANARFVGYGSVGPPYMGRWGGWQHYSLMTPEWIDPNPLMWDGISPSWYTHDWDPSTDYRVWSPQIQFMNTIFMKRDALRLNPDFWLELSVWDGRTVRAGREPPDKDKRRFYESVGQTYTPERYGGYVQFGLWLLRPRLLREYRGWVSDWDLAWPYFRELIATVDRVHGTPLLAEFWRRGELVANPSRRHPYQTAIPERYQHEQRWYLLDTNANPGPGEPLDLMTEIPVMALALVRGEAPRRRWLVYAHAPIGRREQVAITVPDGPTFTAAVAVGGSFYLVAEADGSATAVVPQTPAPEALP